MLPVDKPVGPTSHDVVAAARRTLGERRIGHTGTLDPFASGLLLLLVGSATRLSEYLTGLDKTYEATARLGVATDTLDPEGAVVEEDDAWRELDTERIREALASFVGRQLQVPPRFSAKKVRGEPAHRRVRRGETVELDASEIEVHEIGMLDFEPPEVRFRIRCSSGTYVRSVAGDLGRRLGTVAHLTALRRTAVGDFRVEGAAPGAALGLGAAGPAGAGTDDAVRRAWIPASGAIRHLPTLAVGEEEEAHLRHGRPVPLPEGGLLAAAGSGAPSDADARAPSDVRSDVHSDAPLPAEAVEDGAAVSLVRDGRLLAVGERRGSVVQPRKVFAGV